MIVILIITIGVPLLVTVAAIRDERAVRRVQKQQGFTSRVQPIKPDTYTSPFLTNQDDSYYGSDWWRWAEKREAYAKEDNPEIRESLYNAMLSYVTPTNPPDRH